MTRVMRVVLDLFLSLREVLNFMLDLMRYGKLYRAIQLTLLDTRQL
jgi:hypothetical protein